MTIMESGHPCSLSYEKQSEEILYLKNGTAEAVSSLSAGYQSLIWMVFDIAYRMALLNPELRGRLSETPGIVLIDEPDIHLHPEWQWLLVGALQEVFPNIQFIIASHSPIILASVKDGKIIDIGDIHDSVDFPREDVHLALLREQGGLCAYCMTRISEDNIQIKHWVPQNGEY